MDHRRKHLCASGPEQLAVVSVAADLPRLVVVSQVHRIPGFPLQAGLPAVEVVPYFSERCAVVAPLTQFCPVVQSVVMLKGEDKKKARNSYIIQKL